MFWWQIMLWPWLLAFDMMAPRREPEYTAEILEGGCKLYRITRREP